MKDLRNIKFFQWYYKNATKVFQPIFGVKRQKEFYEWLFWKIQKFKEKKLNNKHYQHFFTEYFELPFEYYNDKKVLDIGCGPRGSLEWATNTSERVGLDTLADKYVKLEGKNHDMTYVQASAENIPFPDNYFDVVSSFNSLDHVDDLALSIKEIKRVLKKGGYFLLIADIHDHATICEPSAFDWNIIHIFSPELTLITEHHYEGNLMYKSIREAKVFDHTNLESRYGILTAKFRKE